MASTNSKRTTAVEKLQNNVEEEKESQKSKPTEKPPTQLEPPIEEEKAS